MALDLAKTAPGSSRANFGYLVAPEIDWDAANRLTVECKDFMAYIKLVRQFYQAGDPRVSDQDFSAD